jgi:hypothetical protein
MAVGTLLVSPLAKGLFHRAIIQSGPGTHTYHTVPRHVGEARALVRARSVGVADTGTDAAAGLRAVDARAFYDRALDGLEAILDIGRIGGPNEPEGPVSRLRRSSMDGPYPAGLTRPSPAARGTVSPCSTRSTRWRVRAVRSGRSQR